MARDCAEPRKERKEREPREPRSTVCHNCNKEGHMARDCGEPRKEREPREARSTVCHNCNKEGHMARDCGEPRKEREPRGGDRGGDRGGEKREKRPAVKCHNCGKDGHFSRDCDKEPVAKAGEKEEKKTDTRTAKQREMDDLEDSLCQGAVDYADFEKSKASVAKKNIREHIAITDKNVQKDESEKTHGSIGKTNLSAGDYHKQVGSAIVAADGGHVSENLALGFKAKEQDFGDRDEGRGNDRGAARGRRNQRFVVRNNDFPTL